jgi:dihydrolipoamide dehydrogenase
MSTSKKYDLGVIGAGPGGYVAAIRASQLGLKAVVIEKDKAGGVCLNIGCIPSKAIIHQAEVFNSINSLKELGVTADISGFNYGTVFKKSRQASERLSKGVEFLLKKNKIDLVKGEAMLKASEIIQVAGGSDLECKNIIIATGSQPREIRGFAFDEKQVLSSTGMLMLEELPSRLLVLGAGAIGMEFAHVMNRFGVEVTVVEMLDRVLPLEDAEISSELGKTFTKRGVKVLTGTKAEGFTKTKKGLKVAYSGKESGEIEVDKILVAVGRKPNSEGLGLEKLGIKIEKGFIEVGDYYETSARSVYAIGDVINTPLLAHVASKEGEIAVEKMAGQNPEKKIDSSTIPGAVYTEPQVASFGLTEDAAVKANVPFKKAIFPYRGVGKAVAVEEPEGFVKLIYDPGTSEILGAHIIGGQATELIHELLLAKKTELLPEDVATMIHAHPTLSEGVMEAARAAEGWAIHI